MSPDLECGVDGEKFFIVGIIIEFGGLERSREECYRMNFPIGKNVGEDSGDGIIRSVGFNNSRSVRVPVG